MRPHNSASKLSESQLPNLINRDPLHHDLSSPMLANWGQHEGSPSLLGNPNRQLFPREQGRPLVSSSQEVWSGSTFQTSLHEASKKAMNWVPRNTQPALLSDSEKRKQVEPSAHYENAWKRLASKHSDSDPHQQIGTPVSEPSSRGTGFGFGFGGFAGSKSFTPGLPRQNDISMAPTTPQNVYRKITLQSLPSNSGSNNALPTDLSKTSLSTSPIASSVQNNQYPHHGGSKVSNLPGLTNSNVASPIHINNNQNSTSIASTLFQQPWNVRKEQLISMFGLRTANPSPSVDASVVAKKVPSNNGPATSSHDVASNEANTQIPRYGEIKTSEVTGLPGDTMPPAAVSMKQSNVASSINIETNFPDTKNVSTLFQHYGSLKSGQMISMSDPGTGSALPSENTTEVVKTPRKRASSRRLQPSVDTTGDVKKPRKRDRKTRSRQSSMDAAAVVKRRPEKRKAETFQHKEALQDLSTGTAEIEWTCAAKCLPEKVEEETPPIETEDQLTRRHKRLIVTSQCMQQLLPPLPMALLKADATTRNESLLYYVAELASEDAFNMARSFTSCHQVSRGKTNFIPEKLKTSEKPADKSLSRVIRNCTGRTKKLEEDLIRYNKKASLGEVRLECKDLMRTVVENRYAKVHTSEEEAAATSEIAAVNSVIQPYITELPMPSKPPTEIKYRPL